MTLFDNPFNLADWAVTTHITAVEFQYKGKDGVRVEFSKRDGPGSWPDRRVAIGPPPRFAGASGHYGAAGCLGTDGVKRLRTLIARAEVDERRSAAPKPAVVLAVAAAPIGAVARLPRAVDADRDLGARAREILGAGVSHFVVEGIDRDATRKHTQRCGDDEENAQVHATT